MIERSVRRQNILFMHNRTQFSAEYFQFIKKLVMSNTATFQSMNQHYLSKVTFSPFSCTSRIEHPVLDRRMFVHYVACFHFLHQILFNFHQKCLAMLRLAERFASLSLKVVCTQLSR